MMGQCGQCKWWVQGGGGSQGVCHNPDSKGFGRAFGASGTCSWWESNIPNRRKLDHVMRLPDGEHFISMMTVGGITLVCSNKNVYRLRYGLDQLTRVRFKKET